MVVEQRLHERLAVVERALERDVVDVGVERRSSSAGAAPRTTRPCGMQDEDVDAARGRGTPRSRPSRCRPRWRRRWWPAGRAAPSTWSISRAEQLHGDVLERQRRAVEQLEHEVVGAELDERASPTGARRSRRRRRSCASSSRRADRPPRKRRETASRDLGVGRGRRSPRSRRASICGQRLGQVEPAVAGKSGQHGVSEADRGRLAAGRDELHFGDGHSEIRRNLVKGGNEGKFYGSWRGRRCRSSQIRSITGVMMAKPNQVSA